MAIFKLYSKSRIGQILYDFTLHLNYIIFSHIFVSQEALKLAFLSNDSYCCDIM